MRKKYDLLLVCGVREIPGKNVREYSGCSPWSFFRSTQPGDALATNTPGMCKYIKLTFKNDELDNKDMNLGTK